MAFSARYNAYTCGPAVFAAWGPSTLTSPVSRWSQHRGSRWGPRERVGRHGWHQRRCVLAPRTTPVEVPRSTSVCLALLAEPTGHPCVSRSLIHRHVPGRLAEPADQLAGDGPVGPQPGHRARHRTSDPPVHSGVSQPRASASSITARPTKRLPPSSSSLVRRMLGVPGITGNRFHE